MGQRVKRFKTTASDSEMIKALIAGWINVIGTQPFKEQIFLLLAQNSFETNRRKAMWNYNVGNITTDGKGSYNYYDDLTTDEQTKPGQWEKKNLKYRAYNSLDEGVADYIKFLSTSSRYANAWKNILNPDVRKYAEDLKKGGYFTGDLDEYFWGLRKLFREYGKGNEKDFTAGVEDYQRKQQEQLQQQEQQRQQQEQERIKREEAERVRAAKYPAQPEVFSGIVAKLQPPKTSNKNFIAFLETLSNESPIMVSAIIKKYAYQISSSQPKVARKLLNIAKSLRG